MSTPSSPTPKQSGEQRVTTPFRLPTGARKKVLPPLYLTRNYAPVIRAPQPADDDELASSTDEDSVEDETAPHHLAARRVDDESSEYGSIVNGESSEDSDLLAEIPLADSRSLRSHTSLSFTHSATPAGYRSDSDDSSPEWYRSRSAGPFVANPTEASEDSLIDLDDEEQDADRWNAATPADRGRDMRRLADYFEAPPGVAMGAIGRVTQDEPCLLDDDVEDWGDAGAGVQEPRTPEIQRRSRTFPQHEAEEREEIIVNGFRDLGIDFEGRLGPGDYPGSRTTSDNAKEEDGKPDLRASNVRYFLSDEEASITSDETAPRGYLPMEYNEQQSPSDTGELMEANENWDLPGVAVATDASPTFFGNPPSFPADAQASERDTEVLSSASHAPRSTFSNLQDTKKDGPPPNETVQFKMRILRSYKDYGLPMREQATHYTDRLIHEAERAQKQGIVIPGLEESLKPTAFRRSQPSYLQNPASNMKRLDVYLYSAPENLTLSYISYALHNTGSLHFVRYNRNNGEIHIRFVHEWSARRFATARSTVQLPLPEGTVMELEAVLVPPTTYPADVLELPDGFSRKVRLGPVHLDVLREMALEAAPGTFIDFDDPTALVETVVTASCERPKVVHESRAETTADGNAVFWIEFANIKDAIKFRDSVLEVRIIPSSKVVFEPDPCQGSLELTMLANMRDAMLLRAQQPRRTTTGSVTSRTKLTRNSSRESARTAVVPAKGPDGLTDYERHSKRKHELMMLQLAAQDELKERYKKMGPRALEGVLGGSAVLPGVRLPVRKRGF